MDIFIYISRFIYRLRYKLIFGAFTAVAVAVYLSGYLPIRYDVSTTLFTGITSTASLSDQSQGTSWQSSNNAHDNIINLVKSKSTLEQISLNLLAQHLRLGDPNKDNSYISADNYKKLLKRVPKDVLKLVVKDSQEQTVENFKHYKEEDTKNFIYGIFNWKLDHYSHLALQEIKVKRKESSDMIEISFQSDDRGIAMNTINFLNKELSARYEELLLSTSNDVVGYFQDQLDIAKKVLSTSEDSLVLFNTENNIINYDEQTKFLTALNNTYETRYEDILLANKSSQALIKQLESQMDTRINLMKDNQTFLNTLNDISTLNGYIAEIEIFKTDSTSNNLLKDYRERLVSAENRIKSLTNSIDGLKHSKEGVSINEMVTQWLAEILKYEKSKAELDVMLKRKVEIEDQYKIYSPVGPNLNRKDREVRVAEQSYLTILHHLGLAKLNQKNILLNSGSLQIITPPELPLLEIPRNRHNYVIAALVGSLIFIFGFFLVIEIIDRTLRDRTRTERLTSGTVIGVFPRNERLKYRGYNKEVQRMAISYLANALNNYIDNDKATIINLISTEQGEGKSYIAKQLREHWENMGFKVTIVSYHKDFNTESKQFLKSTSIYDLVELSKLNSDEIIIVEYAPINQSSIPVALLNEASVNLLVTNAQRVWKGNDQPLFNALKESITDKKLYIYLNMGDREAVEEYTGQLPPYTRLRKLSYKIFNLGLTSKT